MRVLSFIPACLLAAASFVAAAPTYGDSDTSCAPHPTGGNGNDAALQPVISIIANATAFIQPLSDQLSNLDGDACTTDAVSSIVIQLNAIVSTCIDQLEASAQVDLTGLDLSNLCATIYAFLSLTLVVLNTLVCVVAKLGVEAVATIQVSICGLLNATVTLVGCLKVFIDASIAGVLGPVTALVCASVDLLVSIVVKLNVAV